MEYLKPCPFCETVENRLKHLLKSKFIRQFDEKDPRTGKYKLPIEEADKLHANKSGWIPCSERLPEHFQRVVFAIADAKKPYNVFSGVYDVVGNKFRSDADWWIGGNAVSHWMPLPEPPSDRPD